jgi:hypothetical protein
MKLTSTKLSKQQAKEAAPIAAPETLPEYPYGLRISIEGDLMDKLGLKDMPKVGGKFTAAVELEVVACHSSQYEGGESRRECSLQITGMALAKDAKAAEALYGEAKA